MYRKISIDERLPDLMQFVTTIDANNEHRVYRLTEQGWNMRDADGINSPDNNTPITHWLEEVPDAEELGMTIDRVNNVYHALSIPMPAEFHLKQMKELIPEIVTELKKGFVDLTGENPWEFSH